MKAVVLWIFLTCATASAQNFYVLRAKDDPSAKPGLPPEWPVKAALVGSVPNPGAPWVVLAKAQVDALRSQNAAAKEALDAQSEDATKQELEAAKINRDVSISEIESALKAWGGASEKERGEALVELLRLVVDALRALGYDVKPVEKAKGK